MLTDKIISQGTRGGFWKISWKGWFGVFTFRWTI